MTPDLVIPTDVLKAAAGHIGDRASTYDAPQGERSMAKTVAMFNALRGEDVLTEEDGWMLMAILKIVRSQQGNFKLDNYEDLAAYAALAAECASHERMNDAIEDKPQPGEVVEVDRLTGRPVPA